MKKLEIKHLAPYLPYGLKIQGQTHKSIETLFGLKGETVFVEYSQSLYAWADIFDIKPILRPLSDLTKEIEHNGERFVPSERYNIDKDFLYEIDTNQEDIIYIDVLEMYNLFLILLEMHFDVFGLIDKGLAIDTNTLDL
jgi:hypothetical protein